MLVCEGAKLGPELARLSPKEVLISEAGEADFTSIVEDSGASVTVLGNAAFDSANGEKRLNSLYSVKSLDGFGAFDRAEVAAMASIVEYLDITQKGKLPLLRPPMCEKREAAMQIDASTRKSLELTHGMNGGRAGSLLSVIDRTQTAGGARLLERRLSSPSRELSEIGARQDAVAYCLENGDVAALLEDRLRAVPDLDRALSRLSMERGGPRDMTAIRSAISQAKVIADALPNDMPDILANAAGDLVGQEPLLKLLDEALIAEPPLLARDGGFVATGYDAELDEFRSLRDEGRSVIAALQSRYAEQTEISSLKIKHNNVLGYFIEVTATHSAKMLAAPLSETFIHRQTTANQVRFTTVEPV